MADSYTNNESSRFEAVCRMHGIIDSVEMQRTLIRVLITRTFVGTGSSSDKQMLFETMNTKTNFLPRFSGSEDIFYDLYSSIADIRTREALQLYANLASNYGAIIVPDALMRLFENYLSQEVKTAFVPDCEQYGGVLVDLIENNPDTHFTIASRNADWISAFKEVLSIYANVVIDTADIYIDAFSNQKYDLILSVPVFGARALAEGQDFICRDSDMIAVQNLLYHINLDGKLAIVLPAKITFGGGSIAALRSYIEQNYSIREISSLPSGVFQSTAIKTYLFVFSNGRTEEVLLRKYESDEPIRRGKSCASLTVAGEELLFPDEFADLNGWNVEMVFGNTDDDIRAYNESIVKKIMLHDVSDLFRGKAVVANAEGGAIGVINISNLTSDGIDYASLDRIDEEERKVARYALKSGDVLVTSRGTTIKVALFEEQSFTCIPSVNFNVIRPNGMLRGAYLKLFLESPVGIKLLRSIQRGTTVMNMNYKDLGNLEVPLLSIEEQDAIVSEYNAGFDLYKQTIAAAETAWSKIKNDIQTRLY